MKKIHIGIGLIVLAIIAFFTRKYWMPAYATIDILSIDWDNKEVSYQLNLQGQKFSVEKVKFGDDNSINAVNVIPDYMTSGKKFSFLLTTKSDADKGDIMSLSISKKFEGEDESLADFEKNLLDVKQIFFKYKKVLNLDDLKTSFNK